MSALPQQEEPKLLEARTQLSAAAAACRVIAEKLSQDNCAESSPKVEKVAAEIDDQLAGAIDADNLDHKMWTSSLCRWKVSLSKEGREVRAKGNHQASEEITSVCQQINAAKEALAAMQTPLEELLTPKELSMRKASLCVLGLGAVVGCMVLNEITAVIAGVGMISVKNVDLPTMKIYLIAAPVWVLIVATIIIVTAVTSWICAVSDDWHACDEVELVLKVSESAAAGVTILGIISIARMYSHFRSAGDPHTRKGISS